MTELEMMKTADGSEALLAAYKSELVDMAARLADSELRANQIEAQFKSQCAITAAALEERAKMAAPSASQPPIKFRHGCEWCGRAKCAESCPAAPSTSPLTDDDLIALENKVARVVGNRRELTIAYARAVESAIKGAAPNTSPLTDKELADPVYMLAYCEQSDADFSTVIQSRERLRKAAKLALEALEANVPSYVKDRGYEPILSLRKELSE